ncbi:MAG: LOG family protein, partial [Dehalococcoidia bacterium]
KIRPFPVLLFNSNYWKGFLDWLHISVLAGGFISEEDFSLLRVCDETNTVIETICTWYEKQEIVGRKALSR